MRSILFTELEAAMLRRGLRNRRWTVEWDEAAIDFLLEKGFTPDLGARPLQRAVERYLLSPLAQAMVEGRIPARNPFLLVKVDGDRLETRLLEAEVPEEPVCPLDLAPRTRGDLSLQAIAFDPEGSEEEVATLLSRHAALREKAASDRWQEEKDTALAMLGQRGFWETPERFAILGTIEYMERVREGIDRLGTFLERMEGTRRHDHAVFPRETVGQSAARLLLLETAARDIEEGRPRQAFLLVEPAMLFGPERAIAEAFAARLADMYAHWARARGMRIEPLAGGPRETDRPCQHLFAVSGYGSYSVLAPEDGLHVLELPDHGREFRRFRARVRVSAMPEGPAAASTGPARAARLREEALRVFEALPTDGAEVVRRYRESPAPLVRDARRGWRTGRADRVFAGEFDLIPADGA